MNEEQKQEIFEKKGIKYYINPDFHELMDLEADEFIEEVLIKKLNAKKICVGYDCKFGKNAKYDAFYLKEYLKDRDCEVYILPAVKLNATTISSSLIREYLKQGDVISANKLLGFAFYIVGKVIHGKKIAGKSGFPTVNIPVNFNVILPKFGVYITECSVDNKVYASITNVGIKPTINGKTPLVETHIFDFDKDIYNKTVKISFLEFIRPEQKFDDVNELFNRVNLDVVKAKKYFGG